MVEKYFLFLEEKKNKTGHGQHEGGIDIKAVSRRRMSERSGEKRYKLCLGVMHLQ